MSPLAPPPAAKASVEALTLPALIDLTAYHGDSWRQLFRLKYGATPVDLTGATVTAWAQRINGEVVELAATTPNPSGGEIELAAGPDGLPSGGYTYDVEVRDDAGTRTTWIRGTLTVTADITDPAAALRRRADAH